MSVLNHLLGVTLIALAVVIVRYQYNDHTHQSTLTRWIMWTKAIPAALSAIVMAIMLFLGLVHPFG
jgi:hypothetical protein